MTGYAITGREAILLRLYKASRSAERLQHTAVSAYVARGSPFFD